MSTIDENQVIEENYNLVRSIVLKFKPRDECQFDELCQAGLVGFMKGIRKFDPSREVKLQTFVYRPIYWAVLTALQKENKYRAKNKQDSEEYFLRVLDDPSKHCTEDPLLGLCGIERDFAARLYLENHSARRIKRELKITQSRFNSLHLKTSRILRDGYSD